MPSINMIASRRSEKQRFERNVRRLMVVILAEVVLGVLLGACFTVKICNTKARIADLDVQLQKLAPTVRKIEDYEKATASLTPKVQLLQQAQGKTLRWRNMMDEMAQALPAKMWLTQFGSVKAKAGNAKETSAKVCIKGLAPDQSQIGDTMLRLNAYPDFKSVDLNYSKSEGENDNIQFEIAVALKDDTKAKEGKSDNGKS